MRRVDWDELGDLVGLESIGKAHGGEAQKARERAVHEGSVVRVGEILRKFLILQVHEFQIPFIDRRLFGENLRLAVDTKARYIHIYLR